MQRSKFWHESSQTTKHLYFEISYSSTLISLGTEPMARATQNFPHIELNISRLCLQWFSRKKKNKSINPDHCGYEDICVLQLLNFFFITFKLMWTNSVFQPFLRAQVNNYQRTPLSEVWATTAMLDRGFLATFSFRVTILAYYSAMH